jgi:tRNA (guanine26-N2/guanine27-N2)-dimethyltransferase
MSQEYATIQEGKAAILVPQEKKISKKLSVFYNPVMKLNRDLSVLLLNALGKKNMQMCLPLAGSGVRGVRFLLELDRDIIKYLVLNDYSKEAVRIIRKNIEQNKLSHDHRNTIYCQDANMLLLESKGFDYIDIDPFGPPTPYLEAAIIRLSRRGILAVTATDTSALAGSSPKACLRKYWAKPLKNEFMHETGIRILIRRVQLVGAAHDRALVPIFSYAKDHYYRVFFSCTKGKRKADAIMEKHGYVIYNRQTLEREVVADTAHGRKDWEWAGPLWAGKLWDANLVNAMERIAEKEYPEHAQLIRTIFSESLIDAVGFYDIHQLAKKFRTAVPTMESLEPIAGASRTHFMGWGLRVSSNAEEKLINIFKP